MIKLVYAHNGKTIKRMNVKLSDYSAGIKTWHNVDYTSFKKWLCDKYHFVYDAVEWRVV